MSRGCVVPTTNLVYFSSLFTFFQIYILLGQLHVQRCSDKGSSFKYFTDALAIARDNYMNHLVSECILKIAQLHVSINYMRTRLRTFGVTLISVVEFYARNSNTVEFGLFVALRDRMKWLNTPE